MIIVQSRGLTNSNGRVIEKETGRARGCIGKGRHVEGCLNGGGQMVVKLYC